MREFKFRAWDKWTKKMVTPRDGDFIGWHGPSNWKDCYEVMQFTGLYDRNGKEIYEGDIIAVMYEYNNEVYKKHEVKWGTYNIGANGYEYDFVVVGPYVEDEYSYDQMIHSNVVVLGNKFEHPELLDKR